MIKNRILKRIFYPFCRLLLLIVLLFQILIHAQNNQPNPRQPPQQSAAKILFNRIPSELGLSQNVITCSFQDKTGFLWFGTKDGLNRFDGYQFKVYRYDPNDPASISDSLITALFEDEKGRIWVGTEKGLNLFDRQRESFERILPEPNNPNSLSQQNIKSITGDNRGVIWILTAKGVDKLELGEGIDSLGGRFTHYAHEPNNSPNFDNFLTSQILVDETGVVWVTVGSEIYHLTPDVSEGRYEFKKFRLPEEPEHFRGFGRGRNGKVWIAGGKGLFEWDTASRRSVFHPYEPPLFPGSGKLIEDRNGTVWFGSSWGLIRFEPRENRFEFFEGNLSAQSGIFEYGINSILEDNRGALWFGGNGNGLFRYDTRAERFAHYQKREKLALWTGTSIRSFYETTDGELLLGQASTPGILRVNRATGKAEPFLSGKPIRTLVGTTPLTKEIPIGITYSMLQDKTGALWAGTDRFLLKIDLRQGKAEQFISIDVRPDPRKFPFGNIVYKLFEDRAENLWAATLYGIYRFDPVRNDFTEYPFDPGAEDKAMDSSYPVIYEDLDGFIWIGTSDGLFKFDPNGGTFKIYRHDSQNPNSLSHNAVRTIAPDPFEPNVLWLGTSGGGLNRFDKQTDAFSVLTEKNGLPNNVIYGILSDDEGNLWMSTNNGISRFDPRSRTFKNFDKKDGLQDNEFNSCAFFKSTNGELFFGGINGFNAFYPSDVKDNPNPPPVVLTNFQVLNKEVSFREKDSPLKQTITETKEITLNYEQRFFSFEFAALDFTEPGKNQYAYQLENFDKEMVKIGTQRRAFYTNIPPGTYTFRVIASNNDGFWNNEGATIKITILPPFWLTWWFVTLMVLLVIGIIFLIVYPRISKLRFEKEIQEAFAGQLIEEQENDRKRIAAELHDGIGQSLLIIKNRAFLGEKLIHKETGQEQKNESVLEQLDEISGSATEALEQVREIAYYLRPSHLERVGLTSAIGEMIERVADSSEIEFDVKMTALDGVFSPQNEINFYRIVQESLNNIIKHSGAALVKIRIVRENDQVELIIEDNGRGFVPETAKEKRRGFGLKGMSERARLLGGTYSIKSSVGEGTIVTVKIAGRFRS